MPCTMHPTPWDHQFVEVFAAATVGMPPLFIIVFLVFTDDHRYCTSTETDELSPLRKQGRELCMELRHQLLSHLKPSCVANAGGGGADKENRTDAKVGFGPKLVAICHLPSPFGELVERSSCCCCVGVPSTVEPPRQEDAYFLYHKVAQVAQRGACVGICYWPSPPTTHSLSFRVQAVHTSTQ